MNATVFYAWQSDRPGKLNKNLIRRAAEAACSRITEDASNPWNVTLDSDTQGVAGMCDIPNTILDKIKTCSMFLADLTFVGRTEDSQDEKRIPNPNVLFELGFAAGCLGFDPLIGVVNEAYGDIKGQVFDIKRRSSLSYSLPEDATSATIVKEQERLSRQLEDVFRATLDTVVTPRLAEAGRNREQEFKQLQSECGRRVKDGRFHSYSLLPATLLTIQTNVVDELDYNDLYERVRLCRNARPQEESMTWSDELRMVELTTSGLLLHAYSSFETFKRACQAGLVPYARLHPEDPVPRVLNVTGLQMEIVSHAFEQFQLLNTLQLPLPWLVGVSLVGAAGFSLVTESDQFPKAFDADELHFGPCTITAHDQVANRENTAALLRGLLDRICRKGGRERSDCFTSQGEWNQRFIG